MTIPQDFLCMQDAYRRCGLPTKVKNSPYNFGFWCDSSHSWTRSDCTLLHCLRAVWVRKNTQCLSILGWFYGEYKNCTYSVVIEIFPLNRLKNRFVFWQVFCSGGVGIVAWRHSTVLSVSKIQPFSLVSSWKCSSNTLLRALGLNLSFNPVQTNIFWIIILLQAPRRKLRRKKNYPHTAEFS